MLFRSENDIVRDLNVRYLPPELNDLIPERGVFVVKSPKGTGKTELLKKVVADCNAENRSVMMLGHRVNLLENLSVRTGLEFYRDLKDGTLTSDVAVCLNSLATRFNPAIDAPYDTVIIDESEQFFPTFLSKTLERDLSKVFTNFIFILQKARRVIVLDADISANLTIDLIGMIRTPESNPDDDCIGINNTYKIGAGQTTKQYLDKNQCIGEALADLDAGEKVYIATNNKKLANTIYTIVSELMGKTALLVSADNAELDDQQAFIHTPSTEQCNYQCVIATPTLATGISIDNPHFTRVYGLFGINPGTYQDADQAVSRVRECSDVHVWLQANVTEVQLQIGRAHV